MDKLHTRIVDDFVIGFDLRIFLGDIIENAEKQSVAHFQNIGLVYAGYFTAIVCYGIFECVFDNSFTGGAGDYFCSMNSIFVNLLFHSDIKVFRVFAEYD